MAWADREELAMLKIEGDRRRFHRVVIDRPCKVHDPRSGKYYHGRTRDLSTSGLLFELPKLLEVKPGDRVHVGVAMTRRQALLHANEMIDATVVRTFVTADDRTHVAVTFAEPAADVSAIESAAVATELRAAA